MDVYRKAALKTYVESGGTVIAVGEYAGVPAYQGGAPNVYMNDIAATLGSTMSLLPHNAGLLREQHDGDRQPTR